MKIAPSVLASDLADIQSGLRLMEQTGCDMVHWDVMDGHFVPNLTFGPGTIRWGRNHCDLPFDVHLMVTDPMMYLPLLTDVGVEMVSFQIEVTNFAPRLISLMRELGFRPSVAINPQTSLVAVEEILDLVDNVLVMSVDPGFGGQEFMSSTFAKLEKLIEFRESQSLVFSIQVDGGVNLNNASELAATGVDSVVTGSSFFRADDHAAFVKRIRSL
ncbi:MAG: ribulose-phosphate 3-epimerase [Planctomycetales bacterium]|nr:ribulose-phosphate 3-epimerase [bacterium]UNM08834.1 MAG: ribulose-phosphate 3-epimerase [Planctomycetales bacterium]